MPLLVRHYGLAALLEGLTPRRPQARRDFDAMLPLADEIAARLPIGSTCLYRSLARYAVLRRAGRDVVFAMGVRMNDGELEGHAWLEEDGRALDALADQFSVSLRYPPPPEPA